MGFFSDLKEDLSLAVNELMPEELAEKAVDEEKDEEKVEESVAVEESASELVADLSLEEMLKNIDDIQVPQEMEFVQEPTVEEPEPVVNDNEEAVNNLLTDVDLEEMLSALNVVSDEKQEAEVKAEPVEETVEILAEEPVLAAVMDKEPVLQEKIEEKAEEKGAEEMDSYVSRQAVDETAVITAGMQIKGDITSEGSMDVVGKVEGNIDVWGKLNITGHINGNSHAAEIYAEGAKINGEVVSDGAVKIGNSSVIIGNITAKSAAIAGAVKGDIDVQGPVILDSSAIVMGNIKSKSVQINNGAVIEGMCSQCYADVSPLSFFDEYKSEFKSSSKKNK